ncbi:MAG: sulfite exporter TauE/SafE family protein [Clostridiales bacterium]|nr:sulfite exporter TauE/SafE family protein [Clostridiales bacterium]
MQNRKRNNNNNTAVIFSLIAGLFTGFVNGLFGAGGGMLVVPAMQKFLKIEERESHATAIAVILPLTIISTFFYFQNNYIDWKIAGITTVGGIAGGIAGAFLLGRCPVPLLRKGFAIVIIIAAIRMII